MSSRLRDKLYKVGEETLQSLIGEEITRLLFIVDEQSTTLDRLAELLESQYGNTILLQPEIRSAVIQTLKKDEAIALAEKIIGAPPQSDPWKILEKQNYQFGKKALDDLYAWFEIKLPIAEIIEPPPPSTITIKPIYPLYDYQNEIVARALEAIQDEKRERRVLIHMPTGAGKTRCAMSLLSRFLIERPNRVVLWLAYSEELCDQAAEEFQECWKVHGNRDVELRRFYGQHNTNLTEINDGIVVAGLPLMYSRSGSQQSEFLKFAKKVGLVIMDEAHQAVAPTYNQLLQMLAPIGRNTALVGLSATPGRSWLNKEEDEKLAKFFLYSKAELAIPGYPDPIKFLQEKGYLATPEYINIPYTPKIQMSLVELENLRNGFDISPEILKSLANEDLRNLEIMRRVIPEVTANSKVIIFACSVEHAHLLAAALKIKGVAVAAVSSDTPTNLRRDSIEAFRTGKLQVIVNYGILTTGFDAPKTNVAVIARPTQSVVLYSQMVGRAMRGVKVGGNETCRIYTVVDRLPGFRSPSDGFSHWEDIWAQQ